MNAVVAAILAIETEGLYGAMAVVAAAAISGYVAIRASRQGAKADRESLVHKSLETLFREQEEDRQRARDEARESRQETEEIRGTLMKVRADQERLSEEHRECLKREQRLEEKVEVLHAQIDACRIELAQMRSETGDF